MVKHQESIENYTSRLLKKKNYFINELYSKLLKKYDNESCTKEIKKLIKLEMLHDKYLAKIKICYMIHIRMYGKKYIYNFFKIRNISENLVNYLLKEYDIRFTENLNYLFNNLIEKNKTEKYIYNYLLRKGYYEDEIMSLFENYKA